MRLGVVLCGFCALLALAAPRLSAQAVTVDYLEGSASQRTTEGWAALSVGDKVPLDGSVRVDNHSLVQLDTAGAAITLSRPGTYAVRRLLAARASLRTAGVSQAVAVAFSRIVRGSPERLDTVGGVRSERMPGADELGADQLDVPTWMDMVAQTSVESGKDQIASGEYTKAIDTLLDAVRVIGEGDAREARFYLATAYSLLGETRLALAALSGDAPSGTEEWAADDILLRAKLLEDTFAFAEAAELLMTKGKALAYDEERAPMYFFLLALAYRGSGETARETLCLEKVVSLAGDTALGTTAAQFLGTP